MGSDVTVMFTEILAMLAPDVLFGIHDISLPFDHPVKWTSRAYNEQYLLAALLIANPDYLDISLANYWAASRGLHEEPLKSVRDWLGEGTRDRDGGAFWGIKR